MIQFKRTKLKTHSIVTAYIAFLLFFFFLVFSSMNSEKGGILQPVSDNIAIVDIAGGAKSRNVLNIYIDALNRLKVENDTVTKEELFDLAKDFIDNPNNDRSEPEKIEQNVPYFGPMLVTAHHTILLRYSRNTTYEAYIAVRHQLLKAYDDLRNSLSMRKWQKKYANLTPDEQKAIRQIYPVRIAERCQ
jgi:amino acid permease